MDVRYYIYEILTVNIYSNFIGSLRKMDVFLDRKVLAFLAFTDLSTFNVIERQSKMDLPDLDY